MTERNLKKDRKKYILSISLALCVSSGFLVRPGTDILHGHRAIQHNMNGSKPRCTEQKHISGRANGLISLFNSTLLYFIAGKLLLPLREIMNELKCCKKVQFALEQAMKEQRGSIG
jgi:hypothetical protein